MCNKITNGEARGIAIWSAHGKGINTDDLTNFKVSPDSCTIYFEEQQPWPFDNRRYSLSRENRGWRMGRFPNYIFGGGDDALLACSRGVTGVTDLGIALEDASDITAMDDAEDDAPLDDASAADTEDPYCFKPGGFDPYEIGTTTYVDPNGHKKSFSDECKIEGKSGLLAEGSCNNYNPENISQTSLIDYVICNCVDGKCVTDSTVDCNDPAKANKHMDGASVWADEESGKTHISTCNDDSETVSWFYCNDDGTLHEDVTSCEDDLLCGDGMCGGFTCFDNELPGEDPDFQNQGALNLYNPTTGKEYLVKDSCASSQWVREFECPVHTYTDFTEYKKELMKYYATESLCPDDYLCQQDYGICIEDSRVCDESDTDPNNDIYLKGVVTLTHTATGESKDYDDECTITAQTEQPGVYECSQILLTQVDCGTGIFPLDSHSTECPEGEICNNGICEETDDPSAYDVECVDTDDGKDIFHGTKATCYNPYTGLKDSSLVFFDMCEDPKHVLEFYCEGAQILHEIIECPEAFYCVSNYSNLLAECVECFDNDKSDDPSIQGTVIDSYSTEGKDFCNDAGQLKQAHCNPLDGTVIWHDPIDCPGGQTCDDGSCK